MYDCITMKSIFKGKNSTLYIGIAVVAVILLGFLLWMYFGKKDDKPAHNLEEESEAIRQALIDQTQPPRENFAAQSSRPAPPPKRPSLVLFHANWCNICVGFMPTWEQVKQQIGSSVDVMSFEADSEPQAIQQAGNLTGFPTIRLYPDGFPSQKYAEYAGNRQVDSLVRFAMSGGSQA